MGLFNRANRKLRSIEPVGFLEFSYLMRNSMAVLNDSGGVQKEAYCYKKPCVTVRDSIEWIDTLESGSNILSKPWRNKYQNEIYVI